MTAMQIMGGESYMAENEIERIFRDSRINLIVEGANEVMQASSSPTAASSSPRRCSACSRASGGITRNRSLKTSSAFVAG